MVNLSEGASDLSVSLNEIETAHLTRTSINLFGTVRQCRISLEK